TALLMSIPRLLYSLALFALLTTSFKLCAQSQLKLQVTGINGALKDNVDIYLQKFREDDAIPGLSFHSELEREVRTALQALGYYHSEIQIEASAEQPYNITLHVNVGEPVRIETADIQLLGDAAADEDFLALQQQQ